MNHDDTFHEPRIRAIPWTQFREELLALYLPPLRAIATWRQMKHALSVLDPPPETTAGLNLATIARFVTTRPPELSPNTTLSTLRCLRHAAAVAVQCGYLNRSPFTVRPVSAWVRAEPPQGKRHYSRAEIRAVLDLMAADGANTLGWSQWKARRLQALTTTVAYCGLRASEAYHLHVADVDLAARAIYVRSSSAHRTKTARSAAVVPVPAAAVAILEAWLCHRLDAPPEYELPAEVPWMFPGSRRRTPWVGGSVGQKPRDRLQAIARRAGVEGMTWQALRRSWATHAEYWGVPGPLIARVLRHSERVDEMWYRAADLPNLIAAVDSIEF